MLKTSKHKSSKARQPSHSGDRKVADSYKNAIDKLEATVAETRNLQKKYFNELKQLLIRKKITVHALSMQESVALLEVFKSGPGVFESKDKFLRWLNYPNISLGGKTPLKLMLSNKAKLVRDELLRIENGIFS